MNFDEKYKEQKGKSPGKIPEGFFSEFPEAMVNRVATEKEKKSNIRVMLPIYISAAAAVVVVMWFVFVPGNDNDDKSQNPPTAGNDQIHQNHGMTEMTQNIMEKKDTLQLKKLVAPKEVKMDTTITEDDILEFLLDEGYDET